MVEDAGLRQLARLKDEALRTSQKVDAMRLEMHCPAAEGFRFCFG